MDNNISYDELYEMKFGDKKNLDQFTVWRIPGGWMFGVDSGNEVSLQFVPFDNEFMKPK